MICPQNPQDCAYGICRAQNSCSGLANFLHEPEPPPKPAMAEIERLVDVLVDSSRSDGYVGLEADYHLAARTALLAAIRAAIK